MVFETADPACHGPGVGAGAEQEGRMQCEEDWLVMHALHAHYGWSISRIGVPGGHPGCIHGRRSLRLLLRAEPGGGCERYLHLQRKRLGRGHIQVLGIRPTRNGWDVAATFSFQAC